MFGLLKLLFFASFRGPHQPQNYRRPTDIHFKGPWPVQQELNVISMVVRSDETSDVTFEVGDGVCCNIWSEIWKFQLGNLLVIKDESQQ